MSRRNSRAPAPKKKLTRFERETERRRREMLGTLAGRVSHVTAHAVNKAPLWRDAPKPTRLAMRAKAGRKA